MGLLTLTELKTEIKLNLANRSDRDSSLGTYINWGQLEIAKAHTFRELRKLTELATVADSKYITLTANPKNIMSLRLIDGTLSRKLRYIPTRKWDKFVPRPESLTTARPDFYTVWSQDGTVKFELYRIPDAVYTVEMRWEAYPTAMTTDSQTSDYENLDECIVSFATSKAFRSLGNDTKAGEWLGKGRSLLATAIRDDKTLYSDSDVGPLSMTSLGDYWIDPFIRSVR